MMTLQSSFQIERHGLGCFAYQAVNNVAHRWRL